MRPSILRCGSTWAATGSSPTRDAQNWHWTPESQRIEYSVTGYSYPQCSACFINSVQDSLDSILTLAKTEGMFFKWGWGTGTNLSPLRGTMEILCGGGQASGPLSFMKGFDAFAGVIKSGGKTRRAAKMVILNIDHPDIVEFIECKQKEEAKAFTLARAGYDASGPDSEAYSSIFFQNANNSVRVTDEFMQAVLRDGEFSSRAVRDGDADEHLQGARTAEQDRQAPPGSAAIRECSMTRRSTAGTPARTRRGSTPRIRARSTCSWTIRRATWLAEPDEVCARTASSTWGLQARGGDHDYRAGDSGGHSGYPTEAIAKNSHDYRPLGLGYANLGGLLMATGLPYDSDAGRDYAAG